MHGPCHLQAALFFVTALPVLVFDFRGPQRSGGRSGGTGLLAHVRAVA